jgi:hypothetical protein
LAACGLLVFLRLATPRFDSSNGMQSARISGHDGLDLLVRGAE